jgi:hypothetical protein
MRGEGGGVVLIAVTVPYIFIYVGFKMVVRCRGGEGNVTGRNAILPFRELYYYIGTRMAPQNA